MAKILVILIVAAILESIGVVYVKAGIDQIARPARITAPEIFRVVQAGFTNPKIILGVALEAAFFGCFLYMLSQRDVSLIWPLTSIGFIVTTLAARFVLHETVSSIRWAGVVLIAVGALLTSYSEEAKQKTAPPPAADSAAPLRP